MWLSFSWSFRVFRGWPDASATLDRMKFSSRPNRSAIMKWILEQFFIREDGKSLGLTAPFFLINRNSSDRIKLMAVLALRRNFYSWNDTRSGVPDLRGKVSAHACNSVSTLTLWNVWETYNIRNAIMPVTLMAVINSTITIIGWIYSPNDVDKEKWGYFLNWGRGLVLQNILNIICHNILKSQFNITLQEFPYLVSSSADNYLFVIPNSTTRPRGSSWQFRRKYDFLERNDGNPRNTSAWGFFSLCLIWSKPPRDPMIKTS